MKQWYKWIWANGVVTICKGYSKSEMRHAEKVNGKLLKKIPC